MSSFGSTSRSGGAGRRDGDKQVPEFIAAMAELGETFRLASGIFYEPVQLDCAIADLFADGFTKRNICLAGTRQALSLIASTTGASALTSGHSADFRSLCPLFPLSDAIEVLGTSGMLLRKLLKEAAWHQGERKLSTSWLLPELFGRFTEHIRQNAIVLLVSAPDSLRQHQSSRILLKRSAHTVQTHEFSLPHR